MARNIDNHTSITYGLSAKEVNQRIEAGFSNQQSNQETKSYQDIFRDNIFTLFNLINAILAGLIIFIGSFKNLLFLGVVVSNLVIGIVQELRAKKSIGSFTSDYTAIRASASRWKHRRAYNPRIGA